MSLLNFIRERKAKHTVPILVEQNPSFALEVAKDFLDLDRKMELIFQDSAYNTSKSALP